MKRLNISAELKLPVEAVTQTFAILAKRGVGKTYTARVMAEEMMVARQRFVVIDPLGVWWGLRVGGLGGTPVVIVGGEHGDIPLAETDGTELAALVADPKMPAFVIDLSGLRKGAQRRFMREFAETLYHVNREPLHVFLDEADAFAPQRPQKGDEFMLGAVEDIVRRGRARGLGVTLITQRSAVLNKDVLSQVEVLVVLRTTGPQDRDAIGEWVRFHADVEQWETLKREMAGLPIGTAYVWSPGWLDVFKRVRIRESLTFDSSKTPEVGATRAVVELAPVDIPALTARIEAAREQAEANDPKRLRARVAELEALVSKRDLRIEQLLNDLAGATMAEPEVRIEYIDRPIIEARDRDYLGAVDAAVAGLRETLADVLRRIDGLTWAEAGERLARGQTVTLQGMTGNTATVRPPQTAPERPRPVERPSVPVESEDGTGDLRAGARRMLDVMARQHPYQLTKAQLGTLASMGYKGGTFNAYLRALVRGGYITEVGRDLFAITERGLMNAGVTPGTPLSPEEIREAWRAPLRAGARAMFDVLTEVYPNAIDKQTLGARANVSPAGGTFGAYLGTLRRNGLAIVEDGFVRASDTAMGVM